jgi:acyl carrier protein
VRRAEAVVISSRTPEGSPNRCPVCNKDVRIESSLPFGDAPCPNCGCLLWFVGMPEDRAVFEYAAAELLRERTIELIAKNLGVRKEQVEANPSLATDLDSLDVVELVMDLEEEFGPAPAREGQE